MRFSDKLRLMALGEDRFRISLLRRYQRELAEFMQSGSRLRFKRGSPPIVSVIIPTFNGAHHTLRCLKSLLPDASVPTEIIVYDDCSSDCTPELLDRCDGIEPVYGRENLGFISAVNAAAAFAKGKYLLLMNNDAAFSGGTLQHVVSIFETRENVGAVGARVQLATGKLQEAGCVIFKDGTTDGYLRGAAPNDPRAMVARNVDYCSGVYLMVETELFNSLGGFDSRYAPAYYEETDFCMKLRKRGLHVVYTPDVLIEHFEFGSQPKATARAAIENCRKLFVERWRAELTSGLYDDANTPQDRYASRLQTPSGTSPTPASPLLEGERS